MGIFKALKGAAGGIAADSWKEFFYCNSLSDKTLGIRAEKVLSKRSTDTKSNPNVISEGSIVAVADGQCALFADSSKAKEVYYEPGEHEIKEGTASIFGKKGLPGVLDDAKRRLSYGGEVPVDQRIYYFNTKEIKGNIFMTEKPVHVRIRDDNTGLDTDAGAKLSGMYSYRIKDAARFYENVCGNFPKIFLRSQIQGQLNAEFIAAVNEAVYKVTAEGVRPSELPLHTNEICSHINSLTGDKFFAYRGIEIVSIGIAEISVVAGDMETVKELQHTAVYKDPLFAAAALTDATAESMKSAAANEGGAIGGFVGLGLAANAASEGWTCTCGTYNKGKFCTNCGKHRSMV